MRDPRDSKHPLGSNFFKCSIFSRLPDGTLGSQFGLIGCPKLREIAKRLLLRRPSFSGTWQKNVTTRLGNQIDNIFSVLILILATALTGWLVPESLYDLRQFDFAHLAQIRQNKINCINPSWPSIVALISLEICESTFVLSLCRVVIMLFLSSFILSLFLTSHLA